MYDRAPEYDAQSILSFLWSRRYFILIEFINKTVVRKAQPQLHITMYVQYLYSTVYMMAFDNGGLLHIIGRDMATYVGY